MSAKDSSPQIGTGRRYLAGAGSSGAYQPTPNPSAFTVPYRCRRGAQACRYRPCGGIDEQRAQSSRGHPEVGQVPARQAVSRGVLGAVPPRERVAERAVRKPAKICRLIG